MKPYICSKDQVYIPDACNDCAVDCETFSQYKIEVAEKFNAKQDKLTAGDNVVIEGNVISAPNVVHKSDIKAGENITITTSGDTITISANGGSQQYTKEQLLSILGYQELPMSMTDTDGTTANFLILGKRA